jgi:hypothetical protein
VCGLKDFKLQVLEGRTGRLRTWAWMPPARPDNGKKPFALTNGDSVAFLNLSGQPGRRELLMCINFWKNPGIVSLVDHEGNLLEQQEPIHSGSPMLQVNWRGDGQELVLLSGNTREGGMIDGKMRRVVVFPDDGHPDLAAYVADLTGASRDEVILWDQERVSIYTQDCPCPGDRVYKPARNPAYNESNYRTVVSLPGWAGGAPK